MRLGKLLRDYRTMRHLGLKEVAKEIGCDFSTLSRIERGEDMDGKTLIKVWAWATSEGEDK